MVHATDAASWGLMDVRRGVWSKLACDVAGINPDELPKISEGVTSVRHDSGVQVAVGDHQASLLGAKFKRGWLSVNLATGCQVSVLSSDFESNAQTRPYFGESQGGAYLHTVTHLPAGRLLTKSLTMERGTPDWDWLEGPGLRKLESVGTVIRAIVDAATVLRAVGKPVLFSGGLIQKMTGLQQLISTELRAPAHQTFSGDDSALHGLGILATAK